jgi:hypothetical protein
MRRMQKSSIPIVLTGTITPRAIHTAHADPAQRRREYRDAIVHYARFAPVHFLENSGYRFATDPEFSGIADVTYFEHPPSGQFDKGKGFQEFEMLDAWVAAATPLPARFLKITGRYIVTNIDAVLADCALATGADALLERKLWPAHSARTDVACFDAGFYKSHIAGAYLQCDDSAGMYIENVLRRQLDGVPRIQVFRHFPVKTGMNGSKGIPLPSGVGESIKINLRNAFYRLNSAHRFF